LRISKPWVYLFILLIRIKIARSFLRRVHRKLTGKKPDRIAASVPCSIPKTVWMYWDSGEATAPEVVRICIASWRDRNPGWKINVLDKDTAADAVTLPALPVDIPVQAFSDLLRVRLLREFGGVWADATTFCIRPLDHWLPPLAQQGFFAFTWTRRDRWFIWPGVYRALGNWFLASAPQGEIISAWERYSFGYWAGRQKAHVYYWPHVLIEFLQISSRRFRRNYAAIPRIGCFGPHLVHDCVTRNLDVAEIGRILDGGAAPVQKLRWNWDEDRIAMAKRLLRVPAVPEPADGQESGS